MNSAARAPILEAIEISKSYGARLALDNVSLAVHPGEVAGLLGPNGAGKTTTLSILSTLMRPDRGRVLIDGKPPRSDPRVLGRMLGLVPQSLALYPALSAAQNVWHFARMQGLSSAEAAEACPRVLEEVGLNERAGDPMHSFSGGMKRRLNLACGIVHRPAVLMLDEPTVGVDLAVARADLDSGPALRGSWCGGDLQHALHGRGRADLRSRVAHRSRQIDRRWHGRGTGRAGWRTSTPRVDLSRTSLPDGWSRRSDRRAGGRAAPAKDSSRSK